jgi:branched-chain amino acid transport system permease protein
VDGIPAGQFLGRWLVQISLHAMRAVTMHIDAVPQSHLHRGRRRYGLLGIRVLRVETWAWFISGVLAGLSGLMLADLVRLDAIVLTFMVIPAMAAAIVGRLNSLIGTLLGGLLIGLLEALGTPFQAIAPYRSLAPFVVAIVAILWQQRRRVIAFSGGES